MSHFSRRIWGFIIGVVALQLGYWALTFQFDYAPARDRAWLRWHQSPTPENEATWRVEQALTRQREKSVRYTFGVLGVGAAGVAGYMLLRRRKEADFISLGRD